MPGELPRRLGLLALGCALSLGVAELVTRISGIAPTLVPIEAGRYRLSRNLHIGYEPIPGLDPTREAYQAMEWAWGHRGAGNRLGFRDVEHAIEPEEGVFRIVVVGDSISAGQGISDYGSTFPALLERRLRAQSFATEVLNFGVKGYATVQEVATLEEKALPFQPELVILQWCVNDYRGPPDQVLGALMALEGRRPAASSRLANQVLSRIALWRFLRYRLAPGARGQGQDEPFLDPIIATPENTAVAFERLGGLSAREGFRVIVAAFPSVDFDMPRDIELARRQVRGLAETHRFDFLDLVPAFEACEASGASTMLDGLHPSEAGHACAAEALAARILSILSAG
jgi:lysophospholipase L1-like esterase